MDHRIYGQDAFDYLAREARAAGRLSDAIRFEGIALICGELFAHLPLRGIVGAFEQLHTQDGPVGARARETLVALRRWSDNGASGECIMAVATMFTLTARAFVRTLREGDLVHTQRVDVAQVMDDLLADATTLAMGQDFATRDHARAAALRASALPSLASAVSPTVSAL